MKIAIDLRSLSSGSISGVENYALNLLDNLLAQDKENSYILFYNSFFPIPLPKFEFVNSRTIITRWPNKLLNLAFKLKLIKLEQLIGDFDLLFMPNLNQFNVNSNVKVVLTVHDLSPVVVPEFYDFKRRLWHSFLNYKAAFLRADLILPVSEYTKDSLIKLFSLPENKLKVVYPGVDSYMYHPNISEAALRQTRNKYSLPGDYILFLNTIEPRKNLQGLIKAFEEVKDPSFLVIAGKKGWKHSKVFQAIKTSKKAKKIIYLGYVPEQDKAAIIKLSRLLVYPSFYEGFGFQPLEALFCGVPVVVSSVTSLPEIVKQAGLLVNPYNIPEMSFAIDQILNNDALRQELLKEAKDFPEIYDWKKSAKKVLEAFKNL